MLTSINIINPPPPFISTLLLVVWCAMWQWMIHLPGFSVNIAIAPQSFTLLRFVMLQLMKIAPTEETVRCEQRMPLFFYC